jgi:hypothetical protein
MKRIEKLKRLLLLAQLIEKSRYEQYRRDTSNKHQRARHAIALRRLSIIKKQLKKERQLLQLSIF